METFSNKEMIEWDRLRRSQVTGQDTGCVATFPGRPFHDLRCSKNFETNSTFKIVVYLTSSRVIWDFFGMSGPV
jgi:hypothetical protein